MSYSQRMTDRNAQNIQTNLRRKGIREDHIANGRTVPWSYRVENDLAVHSIPPQVVPGPSNPVPPPVLDTNTTAVPAPAPVLDNTAVAGPDPVLDNTAVPVPAPVLAPKTEPEQADPNAAVPAPILEVKPDVETVADPAVPPPALSRYEMSFGEKMGRYGGNIMNAGAKGGMAQVGAMGTTVGEIAGIERKQNQQLEENEIARMAKLEKPSSAALEKQAEIKNMYDTQVKYDQAIQDFIKYGDTVTGPLDMTVQSAKDSQGFGDPEREAFRYRIKEIIISDTLLQTAKTSGAISDKEMALFRSGVPKMSQQEDVWIAWLKQRSIWLKQINQRISDGVRVGVNDEITLNGYTAPVAAPAPAAAPSALTQAQKDAMKNNTPK